MNQIHYIIFRGEKSNVFKVTIPDDLFEFLNKRIFFVKKNNLISSETYKNLDIIIGKFMDLHYDIIYDVLENSIGIDYTDIEELNVEDYDDDKIIVHVYLETR